VPVFIFAQAVEVVLRKPSLPMMLVFIIPAVTIGISLVWFWMITFLYRRFKQPFSSSLNIFLSGLTINFPLLPLLHYSTSRPGYVRYITTDGNFFASSRWLQIVTFAMAASLVLAVSQWREKKKNIVGFKSLKKLLVFLMLFLLGGLLVNKMAIGKETDIWLCKNDKWVKQGNPPYEKPFDEKCGIIDKAFEGK